MAEQVLNIPAYLKQANFIKDRSLFAALVGGVGSGKTRAGALKALYYSVTHPGVPGMVTAPTYDMLSLPNATIDTYREVFRPIEASWRVVDKVLETTHGHSIFFRSTDDPDHLRGPSIAWFHMDEGARSPYEAWQELVSRLRGFPDPQGWLTSTPVGLNWVYRVFVAKPGPGFALHRVSTRDNTRSQGGFLADDYIDRLRQQHQGDSALQEIEGQFVIISGRIYFALDPIKAMLGDCRPGVRKGEWLIWKSPVVGRRYITGLDTATGETGGLGSKSCSPIVDIQTGEVVAVLHGDYTPDRLAELCVPIWKEYDALACVERMGPAGQWTINKLQELGYKKLFYEDGVKAQKVGLTMTENTRAVILAALEEAVRTMGIVVYYERGVQEMLSFIRDEKGKLHAAEGARDDFVMALAMAWRMVSETPRGGMVVFSGTERR